MNRRPSGLRSRSTRVTFVALGAVAVGLLAVEGYLRWLHQPSEDVTRFLFHTSLNVSRWEFLDHERDRLVVDMVLDLDVDEDFVEHPEEGRPAFDRVERPFHVRSNGLGYRDRAFDEHKAEGWRRILVLGDSVAWGKGVDEQHRFSNLLAAAAPPQLDVYNLAYCGFTVEVMAEQIDRSLVFQPDLIVLQAPANDLDQTLWKLAEQSSTLDAARLSLALASHLRSALYLRYLLFGDPYDRQIEEALAVAGERYRGDLEHLFDTCAAKDIEIVVVTLPYASGQDYSGHVVDACASAGDACLGVVAADLDHAERWIEEWPTILQRNQAEPDFVTRTAAEFGFAEADLAPVFPYRHFFHDIVHPDDEGHAIVAAQLAPFLAARWDAWFLPAETDPRETAASASNGILRAR
jgi:lysophospholipase L1-like esterase